MLHVGSIIGSSLLLAGSLCLMTVLIVRDRHMILRALGLRPSLVTAPLPPRIRMVSPQRLAVRYAETLREAA